MKNYAFIAATLYLLLLFPHSGFAQTREVSGVVFNQQTGETIPGVNIVLTGTSQGVTTDIDGKFTIQIPADQKMLTFSYVGMEMQHIDVSGVSYIEVRLVPGVALDEVIVTALGISRSAKSLGYSATNLKSEAISESRETNLINSLSGKVAGVNITSSSGGVGASSSILIRGTSNLTSDNQPLFVIDGIPVNNTLRAGNGDIDWGNGIADINPEDIEELTVLKGAGAAALYGSQGANGVIVIKTKSGKGTTGLGIEYTGSVSFLDPMRLPAFQNKYGPGTNPLTPEIWPCNGTVRWAKTESPSCCHSGLMNTTSAISSKPVSF